MVEAGYTVCREYTFRKILSRFSRVFRKIRGKEKREKMCAHTRVMKDERTSRGARERKREQERPSDIHNCAINIPSVHYKRDLSEQIYL